MVSLEDRSLLIVVPTLDSYELLPFLLDSLQRQTWINWRLLFVDGGSSDLHLDWLNNTCASDSRCIWIEQSPDCPGIFGAMNQGFSFASSNEWLLFWGSDDWAASPVVLELLIQSIQKADRLFDLVVCTGRYADSSTRAIGRISMFQPEGVLRTASFRNALLLGSTPPHQATLFGPGARSMLNQYAAGFRLSADLDYFLRLSRHPGLSILCLDLDLVHMADGGVSGQQTWRRLLEVSRAYRYAFGWFWWFPFLARYIRRLLSLVR